MKNPRFVYARRILIVLLSMTAMVVGASTPSAALPEPPATPDPGVWAHLTIRSEAGPGDCWMAVATFVTSPIMLPCMP